MPDPTYPFTDTRMPGNAVSGAWTSWLPNLTTSSNQPTMLARKGQYLQINKTIFANFSVTINAIGTGAYYISVPVTAAYYTDQNVGYGYLFDVNPGQLYVCVLRLDTNGTRFRHFFDGTGVNIAPTSAVPFVWSAGDLFYGFLNYEAA